MARIIGIGHQDFAELIASGCFYVDKTEFIREWWENQDVVTLIARPRRFGKTLNLNMLECFFSIEYRGQGEIFDGLSIWNDKKYQELQGTYPVISFSFADVKEISFSAAKEKICQIIKMVFGKYRFLLDGDVLGEDEKEDFRRISSDPGNSTITLSLKMLSLYLSRYYGKKVIILLDEYDTPMQEAYVNGYWDEMTVFIRSLFNSTFKTNPYLFRAIMTGITRVSKESVFSDLNNLTVITTTSDAYEDSFGFTQQEVRDALAEYGLSAQKDSVKAWYDGFVFGRKREIYNPWSIINYLKTQKLSSYWANTSSNNFVGKLIQEGSSAIKETMEDLLKGRKLCTTMDEQIVFNQLEYSENAVWSLFLASGYFKADHYRFNEEIGVGEYELSLTNKEVHITFAKMIRDWFGRSVKEYNGFIKALLKGDMKEMNAYMNRIALTTFSYFDTGNRPSGSEPERFYHGFVLGLMVELYDRYVITSNRESGFGRYDVMLKPRKNEDDGIILEFKVYDPDEEENLEDTVRAALKQIEDKNYKSALVAEGIPKEQIREYGFGFEGKKVLIGSRTFCT
ncbi:hypothetical protein D3Z58_20820 [Clostridiaceae bacterium]|nr:hypothetical protein [Clostridiaceae bacterium]